MPLKREYDDISSEEDIEDCDSRRVSDPSKPPPLPHPRLSKTNSVPSSHDPIRVTQPGYHSMVSSQSLNMTSSTSSSYYNLVNRLDMSIVPWYHYGLSRNAAEALLLTSGQDGSYLMRDASDGKNWSVSVRSHNAVRHFQLILDGKKFKFGLAQFTTVDELIRHFDNQPLMSGESGVAVTLLYPYPRDVSEPAIYERPTVHAEMGRLAGESTSNPVLAIGSKEGYLYKIGAIRRSWQRRWFVMFKNEIRYYKRKDDVRPIRIINLEDASEISEADISGRPFSMKLVTPKRTFLFQASSEGEKTEWFSMLKWKLDNIKKSSSEL